MSFLLSVLLYRVTCVLCKLNIYIYNTVIDAGVALRKSDLYPFYATLKSRQSRHVNIGLEA